MDKAATRREREAMHELNQTPARTAFYDAEANVFARYALTPRSRVLSL